MSLSKEAHEEVFKERGKHLWELNFHEAVSEVGGGCLGDLDDDMVQYYVLLALSKTLKNIEEKLK